MVTSIAWLVLAAFQAPATIRGQVVSVNKLPIADAEVSVIGTSKTVLTDSTGSFVLSGVPAGTVVLRVRRIGFKAQHLRVALGPGESRTTEVMLDKGPQLLPELSVTAKEAKPLEFAWTTKYDDFFRRRWLGLPGGTFVSADDIQRGTAIHTSEVLEQFVPGLRVIVHCLGEECTEIQFPRCSRAKGYVDVWVDGKKMARGYGYQQTPGISNRFNRGSGGEARGVPGQRAVTELADALDQISPSVIQFMEVYRGIGSIPAEYSGGCGAVLIWTK